MGPSNTHTGADKAPGAGDMFLKLKGAKHGDIQGEAQDDKHKNEIEVLSWSWGMQGKVSLGGGAAAREGHDARVAHRQEGRQGLDRPDVRAADERGHQGRRVILRKTGTAKIEYLKITIQDGRVIALDVEAGDESGTATLLERVSFTFNKIAIEYTPQGGDGLPQGSTTFEDQWGGGS